MASDSEQYKEALWRWNDLQRARRFSVSPSVGVTAIVVSTMTKPSTPPAQAREEKVAFWSEGQQLATRLEEEGARVALVHSTTEELLRVVKDEDVSSIHTIGHGTLSHL